MNTIMNYSFVDNVDSFGNHHQLDMKHDILHLREKKGII